MKKKFLCFTHFFFLSLMHVISAQEDVKAYRHFENFIGNNAEVIGKLSAEDFIGEKKRNIYFSWTSDKKEEARYPAYRNTPTLHFYQFEPPEVKCTFKDGILESIYISIYNRGDNGEINSEHFQRLTGEVDARISELTGVAGEEQKSKLTAKATNRQKIWISEPNVYIMRWSSTGKGKTFVSEYIQLSVEKFDSKNDPRKESTTSMDKRDLKKGDALTENIVREEDGTVYVDNIPMVDQGSKGYCAVAVGERIMRYFGTDNINQHILAQVAGTSESGTSRAGMITALKKIGAKFGIRIRERYQWYDNVKDIEKVVGKYNGTAKKMKKGKIEIIIRDRTIYVDDTFAQMDPEVLKSMRMADKNDFKKFQSLLKEYVNKGIPVIWCLTVGIVPENIPQTRGKHMRLLIGYNEKENTVIYSDTWGAGHEKKSMNAEDAWMVTDATLTLEPKK